MDCVRVRACVRACVRAYIQHACLGMWACIDIQSYKHSSKMCKTVTFCNIFEYLKYF